MRRSRRQGQKLLLTLCSYYTKTMSWRTRVTVQACESLQNVQTGEEELRLLVTQLQHQLTQAETQANTDRTDLEGLHASEELQASATQKRTRLETVESFSFELTTTMGLRTLCGKSG